MPVSRRGSIDRAHVTCQRCGSFTLDPERDGWLYAEHRGMPGVFVIRCPQHIDAWSLRWSEGTPRRGLRGLFARR